MEYYFEVYFDCCGGKAMLVKAKDVIEAGNKAAKRFLAENEWCTDPLAMINKITRTT